jgi:hypothetical protein
MQNDTMQERCFSKTGLAQYLNKSLRWLDYQLVSPHPPPGFKINKSWVFKKSEIDAWLEQFRAGVDLDQIVSEVVNELGAEK